MNALVVHAAPPRVASQRRGPPIKITKISTRPRITTVTNHCYRRHRHGTVALRWSKPQKTGWYGFHQPSNKCSIGVGLSLDKTALSITAQTLHGIAKETSKQNNTNITRAYN